MTDFVRTFRALGDPARQKMLALLEPAGEMCVADLAGHFAMTQPSVSHHLRILKDAGLVTADKRGREVYYRINPAELRRCCGAFFANFACCQGLLATTKKTRC
ncbi:MAG: metalloregulator ArsR/SmtB family transcription factor [Candidatus Binatia bacterium]